MDSIKHSLKLGGSKTKQGSAAASKEANKTVAKDNNVRMTTRLQAAKNAAADKLDEKKHKREGEVHRHAAKHNY